MAKTNREELKSKNFVTLKDVASGRITKVIAPNPMQIGLEDSDFNSTLTTKGALTAEGAIYAHAGVSGSLTHLVDGSSYLLAGTSIAITTGSTGAITITNTAAGMSNYPLYPGSGLKLNSGDSSYDGTVAQTIEVKSLPNYGLGATISGVYIDYTNMSTTTPALAQKVILESSGRPYTATVLDLLSLGTAGTLANPITIGKGLYDSADPTNIYYNNTAGILLTVQAISNGGIGTTASGVEIDPSNISTATVATDDIVLIGDTNDLSTIKTVTAQSIADLASVGALTNALTIGNGVQLDSGTTFDGSAARTLSVDADGSTISVGAAGIAVASIPNDLTVGDGIQLDSGTTFDGSAARTISVDLASNSGLNFSSGELKLDVNALSNFVPVTSDYIPGYDVGSTSTGYFIISDFIELVKAAATDDADWTDRGSSLITTSSVSIAGGLGNAHDAADSGADVYFFVSGSRNSLGTTTRGSSVFAGDTYVSGALQVDRSTRFGEGAGNVHHFTGSVGFKNHVSVDSTITIVGAVDSRAPNTFGTTSSDLQQFTGSAEFKNGLSGSLTQLVDGSSYMLAGSNITILSASNGAVTINAVAGGGGVADGAAKYLVLEATASLSEERVFNPSNGLKSTDGGSGGNYTLSVEPADFAGAGLEDDGSDNLRIAASAAGDGLTGGAGSALAVGAGTGVSVAANTVGINDAVVATLSGSQFSGGVGLTSTLAVTGSFFAASTAKFDSGLSGSLTHLADGTSYLVAGSNVTITTGSSGAVTIGGAATMSIVSGSTSVSDVSTINFSNAGIVQNLGSGTVAITGSIGPSEDGTYTDGLFTDFDTRTPVGTAVDRFNEVLKGLAPGAAPALDDMDCDDSGTNAVLSFGSSQSVSGYTNVIPSGLTPTDNLSDIDINGTFSSTTSSNDIRVACFAGSTTVNGTLNADVSADGANYDADSFGNGDQGTLKLFVNNNSTEIHSTDLSSFGSGTSLNGNGSGFILSATTPGHFSDGSNFATFQHRQGTYLIHPDDQQNGWNYARVVHTIAGTDTTCNYVEWVNDPDSNALAAAGPAMDTLSMTGTKNLSGVIYNTGGTAQYRIRITNAYRNVYSTSTISFNGTNCSVPSQAFPSIDYAGGETETKILHLTGSATITGDPILDGSIAVSTDVPAPLKSDLSSAGSQSISGILLYDLSDTATSTSENFRGESYRLISGSYDVQADVVDAGNVWVSTTSLVGVDGLMFYNSRLYAPVQGGSSGDFRNTADGGSISNGPSSNVNYSGITSGLRTFYRYITNTSGGSKTGFSLTIGGSGTIASQPTALSTSNLHVLLKLPTTTSAFETGWMDLAVAFATGQTSDGDGCLEGSLDSSLNATNTATFGTQSVGAGEYVMIKIEADASFTGYISSMSVSWS